MIESMLLAKKLPEIQGLIVLEGVLQPVLVTSLNNEQSNKSTDW